MSMSEGAPNQEQSIEQLKTLLVSDFMPPDTEARIKEADESGSVLGAFLAAARTVEDIDAQMAAPENHALGETVERLLEPAPVTGSFKRFIAGRVRRAQAWETVVDEVVAPDRLGLTSGAGIFDPSRAKNIELQTLRGWTFDIIHENTFTVVDEDCEPVTDLPPVSLRSTVWPKDYVESVTELFAWTEDYVRTYGEDPYEGLDDGAYLDAVPKAVLRSEVDPLMADFLDRLGRLRDDEAE
jgi:hypothetical protein